MQNYLYIHLAVNMIDNYFRVYPGKMRFIQELSQETTSMLSRIYRQSKHFEVRRRSHCILLSFEDFTTTGLRNI